MMYGGPGGPRQARRARREAAARVGLTDKTNGTTIPASAPPSSSGSTFTPSVLWKSARTTWHGFRRVLALVWDANPGLTLALALLNLLQGAVPALRVWLSKLLVDAVVSAVTTGAGTEALPQVVA